MKLERGRSDPRELRELANSQQAQDEALELAKAIRKDAQRLAPERTGNLRRHIVVEEITDLRTGIEGFAVGWDNKGFYGMLVEFGHEGVAPQPHLVPAAIRNGATAPRDTR